MGAKVGFLVGLIVGAFEGLFVGANVGLFVGLNVGCLVGLFVGAKVGFLVGRRVGACEKVSLLATMINKSGPSSTYAQPLLVHFIRSTLHHKTSATYFGRLHRRGLRKKWIV